MLQKPRALNQNIDVSSNKRHSRIFTKKFPGQVKIETGYVSKLKLGQYGRSRYRLSIDIYSRHKESNNSVKEKRRTLISTSPLGTDGTGIHFPL